MQPIAESDHGLCGNHKPNRFFRVEQKRKLGLAMQGLVFFRKEGRHICISPEDILYQAASVWNEMTEYKYKITYGYKKKLYHINLSLRRIFLILLVFSILKTFHFLD